MKGGNVKRKAIRSWRQTDVKLKIMWECTSTSQFIIFIFCIMYLVLPTLNMISGTTTMLIKTRKNKLLLLKVNRELNEHLEIQLKITQTMLDEHVNYCSAGMMKPMTDDDDNE